jgi:hypothetical protein
LIGNVAVQLLHRAKAFIEEIVMSSIVTAGISAKVTKLPADELALTNKVFLSPRDYKILKDAVSNLGNWLKVNEWIFTFEFVFEFSINTLIIFLRQHKDIKDGLVGFSSVQRRFVQLSLNETVQLYPYIPEETAIYLSQMTLETDFFSKNIKSGNFTLFYCII